MKTFFQHDCYPSDGANGTTRSKLEKLDECFSVYMFFVECSTQDDAA
jgi:hypothetical protein